MPFSSELISCVNGILQEQKSTDKPPTISTTEMIACIIVKKGVLLTLDEIGVAVIQQFPLFAAKIAKEVKTIAGISSQLEREVVYGLRSYNAEFFRHRYVSRWDRRASFGLSEHAARFILRDHIYPLPRDLSTRTTHNHLGGLPNELKNAIFEYVLVLHEYGVWVRVDDVKTQGDGDGSGREEASPKALVSLPREPEKPKNPSPWKYRILESSVPSLWHDSSPAFVTPLPTLLSLLAVDRATNAICKPIFYGMNQFHMIDLRRCDSLLRSLETSRAINLRKITLSLHHHDVSRAAAVFTRMRSFGITSLGLVIIDKDWKGFDSERKKKTSYVGGELFNVRGLETLLELSSEVKIAVEGEWEKFATWLHRYSKVKEVTFNGKVVSDGDGAEEITKAEDAKAEDVEAEAAKHLEGSG